MKKFALKKQKGRKGNVIDIKSKKPLSKERIDFLNSVNNNKKEEPVVAYSSEEIPDDSLMITGVSGNMYALTETALKMVISGDRDITDLEFYQDFLPIILNEWLLTIPLEESNE